MSILRFGFGRVSDFRINNLLDAITFLLVRVTRYRPFKISILFFTSSFPIKCSVERSKFDLSSASKSFIKLMMSFEWVNKDIHETFNAFFVANQ
jgi:hypothetical protein